MIDASESRTIRAITMQYPCSPPPSKHVQLAVRDCASDSSPYVRKCAANAIPKIFVLDPDQGPQLWQVSYIFLAWRKRTPSVQSTLSPRVDAQFLIFRNSTGVRYRTEA